LGTGGITSGHEQYVGYREAEHPGGLAVDDQLVRGQRLDRKVGRKMLSHSGLAPLGPPSLPCFKPLAVGPMLAVGAYAIVRGLFLPSLWKETSREGDTGRMSCDPLLAQPQPLQWHFA
jgi:hypothetical protein